MKIAIVENGGSNIFSLKSALENFTSNIIYTKDAAEILSADRVILPGVGSANRAMEILNQNNLVDLIQNLRQPVLGICLGMQILFSTSEEGEANCLNIFKDKVKKFQFEKHYKVPHMGWNKVHFSDSEHPLFKELENNSFFYFVHSFFVEKNNYTIATTEYKNDFSSIVQKNNFYGMQFHPEKSSHCGLKILQNFLFNLD